MEQGAIILKIGDNRIARENTFKTREETQKYLFEELISLVKKYEKAGFPLNEISVKYDPNYQWE
jgi:hypothetical protein